MATIKEQTLINELATEFAAIDGIKVTFGFAQNPDALKRAQLPAVILFPESFTSAPKAHHNLHRNELNITGMLFVAERMSSGGKLKFLENAALPFMYKVRWHFQQHAVIQNLLSLGLTQAMIVSGEYGAGGPYLTYADVPYIGIVFRWTFIEIN
jgi:hypothetical protein